LAPEEDKKELSVEVDDPFENYFGCNIKNQCKNMKKNFLN